MHMCFGNYRGRAVGRRSYRPLFPHLARATVQQLALEFASREMAEIELAREIQPPMELAVGLVDVKNTWVEPPELVAERLRLVLKHIEPERVHVTPDCGFSQTARFIAVPEAGEHGRGVRDSVPAASCGGVTGVRHVRAVPRHPGRDDAARHEPASARSSAASSSATSTRPAPSARAARSSQAGGPVADPRDRGHQPRRVQAAGAGRRRGPLPDAAGAASAARRSRSRSSSRPNAGRDAAGDRGGSGLCGD